MLVDTRYGEATVTFCSKNETTPNQHTAIQWSGAPESTHLEPCAVNAQVSSIKHESTVNTVDRTHLSVQLKNEAQRLGRRAAMANDDWDTMSDLLEASRLVQKAADRQARLAAQAIHAGR